MTHRAETILVTAQGLVTGLPTTATRVVRGRVWPTTGNSLSVDMGQEREVSEPNIAFLDRELDIEITLHASGAEGETDTILNQMEAEVYAAMRANLTLGLGYVSNTRWSGRAAPGRFGAEQSKSDQTVIYTIQYRHSRTSAEA